MADSILTKSFSEDGSLANYLSETFGWAVQLPKLHFEQDIDGEDLSPEFNLYNLRDYGVGYRQKYPLINAVGFYVNFENFEFNRSSKFEGTVDCILYTQAGYPLFTISIDGDWYIPDRGNGAWFTFRTYNDASANVNELVQLTISYRMTGAPISLSFDYEMTVFPIIASGSERNIFSYLN